MAYPGEVSRITGTTPNGTAYTELRIDPYASGDPARVLVPDTIADGDPVVLLIAAHGHGGDETTIFNPGFKPIREGALDRGWVVSSAYASGNAWSNDEALDDYARLYQWVADTWQVTDVLLQGASMGGLTMANAYYQNLIPDVRGMVGVDSAMNIAYAYQNSVGYAGAIRVAYGIAQGGADLYEKTEGHRPIDLSPVGWSGKRMMLTSSPNDTAIPKSEHTDRLVSAMGSYPDLVTYTGTGGHVEAGNYFPVETLAFYEAVLAGEPLPIPLWPEPAPLPPGLIEVEMFTVINGQAVKIAPALTYLPV